MHRTRARARRRKPAAATRVYHPGPQIADEASLREAAEALREKDPELVEALIAIGGAPPLRRREPGFAGLAAIIVSQQVSVASASAIFGRLEERIAPLDAARLAAATEEDLRACGLSGPKIRALRALAEAVAERGLDLAGLARLDAEDAHAALVGVKGVGPWTADIFLLFCLGHPDAFPAGDLALQEAAKTGARAQDPARRRAARADRRALAPLARRRGAHALGLLSGRESNDRGWLWRTVRVKARPLEPRAQESRPRSPMNERCPRRTPHPSERRPHERARRISARLWRGRKRSDRARPAMAQPDASGRFRVAQRAGALPRNAARAAMVCACESSARRSGRRGRALERRGQGARRPRCFSRRGTAAASTRRFAVGAGRLQPGHDDGVACRPAAQARPGGDPGLFGHACRSGAVERGDRARRARRAPPVLLIHGDQDPLIPLEAMFMASEALAGAQIPTEWHISLGIGHGIDEGGLTHGALFLARALGSPKRRG